MQLVRTKFKQKRIAKGLSQQGLAKQLNCAGSYISKVEKGLKDPSQKWWDKVKNLWDIPDEEIESYRKKVPIEK